MRTNTHTHINVIISHLQQSALCCCLDNRVKEIRNDGISQKQKESCCVTESSSFIFLFQAELVCSEKGQN